MVPNNLIHGRAHDQRRRYGRLLKDGWTAVTIDGQLSAQWEHTVLVTDAGVEILTA